MGTNKKQMSKAVKTAAAEARGELPKGSTKKMVKDMNAMRGKHMEDMPHGKGKRACK